MNRRGILSLMAAAPFASRANPMPTTLPSETIQSAGAAQNIPRIAFDVAHRMIRNDPIAMAEIRAEITEIELRNTISLDPDIKIMKSWSLMAKVTFQRQRNIERAIEDSLKLDHNSPRRYLVSLERYLNKLMWT